jgi:acyl dehydratase
MGQEGYDAVKVGETIRGPSLSISRESIREFAEASLDFNPLHLDDEYMKGSFGKTQFGGVIMHGMTNFGLLVRMMTDWLSTRGGVHRRLEARWLMPVYPGDTITARGTVIRKLTSSKSRWVVFAVEIRNLRDDRIATGEAMAEFPRA